jgi:exodeoxyribonuclease VII small subunit
MDDPDQSSADALSYEVARAELAEVVRALEGGGQSLEESLALWQRGEQLADLCQRWLDRASAGLDAALAARDARGATDPEAADGPGDSPDQGADEPDGG